jgi:hypothetical protein
MTAPAPVDDTGWIDYPGGSDIPPDRIAMLPYVGRVPEGDVDAPGFSRAAPQAFMVEMGAAQPPLRTHFHVVDQFQVILRGSGRLGRHAVQPGAVHYADRLTPYGPLSAGADGLAYLTLRTISDTGAHYMPDSRDGLRSRLAGDNARPAAARRNVSIDTHADGDVDAVSAAIGGVTELLDDADGLRLVVLSIGPHERRAVTDVGGTGAYLVVTAGAVVDADGTHRGPGALRWLAPRHGVALMAGSAGTTVSLLQLPRA